MTNQLTLDIVAGTAVTASATFANPQANVPPNQWTPVDPSTVTLTYVPGTSSTPVTWTYGGTGSIVRVSAGVYTAELDTTGQPGQWKVKWHGTGACAVVTPWSGFNVEPDV